jgi:hypothetical protein
VGQPGPAVGGTAPVSRNGALQKTPSGSYGAWLAWSPWRDRWSLLIWHDAGCPVPDREFRSWARYEAQRHLAALLARPRELAPVFTRHRTDMADVPG